MVFRVVKPDRTLHNHRRDNLKPNKKQIILPIIFGGSCHSNDIIKENSKCYHENSWRHGALMTRICAGLITTTLTFPYSFRISCTKLDVRILYVLSYLNLE